MSVYVRPHDLDVSLDRPTGTGRGWPGRIRRLTPLGGLVRLDLDLDNGTALHVQLTRDRCVGLNLAVGQSVYVIPKDIKVFVKDEIHVHDYVI